MIRTLLNKLKGGETGQQPTLGMQEQEAGQPAEQETVTGGTPEGQVWMET